MVWHLDLCRPGKKQKLIMRPLSHVSAKGANLAKLGELAAPKIFFGRYEPLSGRAGTNNPSQYERMGEPLEYCKL